jgi:DNA-binding LacI/PurR family transcriptional regulator
MAATATRMLVQMIDGGTLTAPSQETPTTLVARRSTAPRAGG